jgi:hypothetical protein
VLDPVVLLLLLLLLVSLLHYGVSARYAVRVEASISISSLSWGWGMCRSIVTRATDASAAAHARHSAVAALATVAPPRMLHSSTAALHGGGKPGPGDPRCVQGGGSHGSARRACLHTHRYRCESSSRPRASAPRRDGKP